MNRLLARQMNLKERNGTGKAPSSKDGEQQEEGREDLAPPDRPMDAIDGAWWKAEVTGEKERQCGGAEGRKIPGKYWAQKRR